jgi:hypothetical protein
MVVVPVHFLVENSVGMFYIDNVLPCTGSNESVLEPAVGAFNFAFSLRREGINNLNIAVIEHLFPLRVCFVGEQMMPVMEFISSPNEPEDGMGINVGQWQAIGQEDSFKSFNVNPNRLVVNELGVKHESGKVVN